MHHNLNLNWLRSFEVAARLLSFTGAGLELNLTQTAISQHIKALEVQLGEPLFERRPKSLQLTDAGRAYLPKIREALETIEMSTTGLFGPQQANSLVVRASMAFIIWITPRLAEFQRMHPDIGLKLVTSIWRNSTNQQPVDVDIVLASSDAINPNLEKLSDESIVPVCGSNARVNISCPQDLLLQKPIHISGFDDHWARYLSAQGLKPSHAEARLVTDTSVAALEMVASNLGCAVVIERFAKQAIKAGRKIHLIGQSVKLGQSHYLLRAEPSTRRHPNIEIFESWLRQQF